MSPEDMSRDARAFLAWQYQDEEASRVETSAYSPAEGPHPTAPGVALIPPRREESAVGATGDGVPPGRPLGVGC